MSANVHIVGSGLTGATIARLLHDQGYAVTVFERRAQIGGNVHDFLHSSGIRVHSYGPHYFRTNSEVIWAYVQRFGSFFSYRAVVKSYVDGQYENWPILAAYLKRIGAEQYHKSRFFTAASLPATNFEEAALQLMPVEVYEKFVKNYTFKQWGVEPKQLSPDLVKRFEVHYDDDPHLTPGYKWQGLPVDGYAQWMTRMLDGIELHLGVDYLQEQKSLEPASFTVFTGPIDAFFGFDLGRLHYRGQKREHHYLPNTNWYQPCAQVNNPALETGDHIRTLEWKHLIRLEQQQFISGTLITRETPFSPQDIDQYEYPFPDNTNQGLYQQYRQRAQKIPNLLICGRLGEYRYYDMDQAIGRAMMLVQKQILPVLSVNSGRKFSNLLYF
ncbi:MAG: UDP-galactopyranose mutase [Haliscomenobacter sp.]|uniref:UDP-galactopyranose mutase n=1 Tax=Haliscomenobacter sp. TaxID=2717303 RepID=UPI0029A0FDA9|nr:UDP-galactopyranose mutase [Haliscomenobacter sp.]MDX2072135.1 UDP-galactopyranose mutase [Haliscomenobacter sp.]